MLLNVANSDTQSQVKSQQMEWQARYYIVSKDYLWNITKNYNINSKYYQHKSYVYPTKYLGRMTHQGQETPQATPAPPPSPYGTTAN